MMHNFDLRKYLAEGKLLKENIEQYIDSEDDISDIRGGKTMAINFNRRMNGGQRKEAVEAYVYDKYGNDVELDWRDGQEVEIHIGNASNDPSPSNNLGVSDLNKYVAWKKKNFPSIHSPVDSPLREGKELDVVKEGVWNLPTEDEVIEFVAHVEDMKDKFYHIGSDDVFNGLDQAIIAAKDLAMNRTYVEDPSNPLGEPGSLNEFEVGDTVVFKGMAKDGEKMTVVGKRKMFAVKDNGRNLIAIKVELPDGTKSEYDETQLTKFSR